MFVWIFIFFTYVFRTGGVCVCVSVRVVDMPLATFLFPSVSCSRDECCFFLYKRILRAYVEQILRSHRRKPHTGYYVTYTHCRRLFRLVLASLTRHSMHIFFSFLLNSYNSLKGRCLYTSLSNLAFKSSSKRTDAAPIIKNLVLLPPLARLSFTRVHVNTPRRSCFCRFALLIFLQKIFDFNEKQIKQWQRYCTAINSIDQEPSITNKFLKLIDITSVILRPHPHMYRYIYAKTYWKSTRNCKAKWKVYARLNWPFQLCRI